MRENELETNSHNLFNYVTEWLEYQPDTGKFYWKKNSNKGTRQKGIETATTCSNGYRLIKLKGKLYRAHRIAFLIMKGEFPYIIDHIDRDRSNNIWSNLREVTHSENCLNRGIDSRNKTGVTGVRYFKKENVFTVTYGKEYLGRSKDFFEAVCLRKIKEKELNGYL